MKKKNDSGAERLLHRPVLQLTALGMAVSAMFCGARSLAQAPADDVPVDLKIEGLIKEFETRDERLAREQRRALSAARRAALERLGTEPTPEALAYGREQMSTDPENFSLRLRMVDLLRLSGAADEADQLAAAIVSDPLTAQDPETRQRALLKRVRLSIDRQDFETARQQLREAVALKPGSEIAAASRELESRIAEKEQDFIARAEVERLGTVPTPAALAYGREAAQRNPSNLRLRRRLVDLLGQVEPDEADRYAEAYINDPLTAQDAAGRQRMMLKRAGFAIERGDFAAARRFIAEARAASPDPELIARADELSQRADRREYELAIRSELDRIGTEPTREALAGALALYQREPQNADVAFRYADLLRKRRAYAAAEGVYRVVLAGPGATDPEIASRAQLGLANLYVGSGRYADASSLIADVGARGLTGSVADRALRLEERLAQRLQPNQFSGSVALGAGHDSNAATRADVLDDDFDEAPDTVFEESPSPQATLGLVGRYLRVIDANGNGIAVNGSLQQTSYTDDEVDDIDRSVLEASAGPVYALPRLQLVLSGGLGYRYRLRDYAFARRTASAFLRTDSHISQRLRLSTDWVVDRSDDADHDRDATGVEAGAQGRYTPTGADKLSLELMVRNENARENYETRLVYAIGASYRHDFTPTALGTPFTQLAVDFARWDYEAPSPFAIDEGDTREDENWQYDALAGLDWNDGWRAALRLSYLDRKSTLSRYDADSLRVLLTVTRSY